MQITQVGTWLSELPNLTGLAPLSILKPSINSITETLQRGQRFVVQCTHLVCSFGAASTGSYDLSGLDSTTSMLAAHKMHHHCPAQHLYTSLETYVRTGESITSGNRCHQFCSCCGSVLVLPRSCTETFTLAVSWTEIHGTLFFSDWAWTTFI